MKNFKEIAEKCLNGELFGVFRLSNGRYVASQFLCKSALTKEYYFLDPVCVGRRYDEYGLCMFSTQFHIVDFIPALDKSGINMKQERNVKLTLEKAKEWYKKGGELKEVALQAFNEEELKEDPKPRSWEEYLKRGNHPNKQYYIDCTYGTVHSTASDGCAGNLNHCSQQMKSYLPSEELAEAFLAMMQLMSLRQAWISDWKPDWKDDSERKWCITLIEYEFKVELYWANTKSLSFPSEKMAKDFMNCFKDLLEIAKPLI